MEGFDWTVLVSAALAVITAVAGGFWLKAKGKLGAVVTLGREVMDVADQFKEALEDDKIDKKEVDEIKKELEEAKAAFRALIGK